MAGNCRKWIDIAEIAEMAGNDWKWIDIGGIGWEWLATDGNLLNMAGIAINCNEIMNKTNRDDCEESNEMA